MHDPRRQQILARQEARRPGSAGSLMLPAALAPPPGAYPSSSADLGQPSGRCGGGDLASIPEGAPSAGRGASAVRRPGSGGPREAALQRAEPWRSEKVAEFASRLGEDKALEALVLQGPRGTALRAVGEAEDHKTASRVVVEMEQRRLAAQAGKAGPAAEAGQLGQRRNAVPRSSDIALASPPPRAATTGELAGRPRSGAAAGRETSFGAVYEYRDSCGTPQVVASTGTVPERQFLLDRRHHETVLAGKQEPSIVWVGISGGAGGLSEPQMTEVRRAVAGSRAERLQAKKLSDIKPYSRHG